jgi:alkylation response protein AidB-like acyl-CoA dehydrogenase
MDFRFGSSAVKLRSSVHEWLTSNLPPELEDHGSGWVYERETNGALEFSKRLAKQGWLVASWPKEFGGGFSLEEQVVLNEELTYAWAPVSINSNRVGFAGPTLILFGTPEQQRKHLPGIQSGEVMWCQGFSEPGAGSDLASLVTTATRTSDGYYINGHKTWTSYAHFSDWMILLARTDPAAPKHRGISYFLLDMKTPGITINPIRNAGQAHVFNEVILEDVFIPSTNLVGEENHGWMIANKTLEFERSSVATLGRARRLYDYLLSAIRSLNIEVPQTKRNLLADLRVSLEIGRMLSYYVLSMQIRAETVNHQASTAKLFNTEVHRRLAYAAPNVLGLEGNRYDAQTPSGLVGLDFIYGAIVPTVAAGSSEIQRNLIAYRGLGLPRE